VTVWVLISVDEATVMAVAETAVRAQAAAVADAAKPLTWRPGKGGRFINDEWDYEVRPFEVLRDAEGGA
jgi:hypothetical protein